MLQAPFKEVEGFSTSADLESIRHSRAYVSNDAAEAVSYFPHIKIEHRKSLVGSVNLLQRALFGYSDLK